MFCAVFFFFAKKVLPVNALRNARQKLFLDKIIEARNRLHNVYGRLIDHNYYNIVLQHCL